MDRLDGSHAAPFLLRLWIDAEELVIPDSIRAP